MNVLFFNLLCISIEVGVFVLIVLILKAILSKAPKWLLPVLWGIVGLRLVIPYTLPLFSEDPIVEDFLPYLIVKSTMTNTTEFTFNHNGLNLFSIIWLSGLAVMFIYIITSSLILSLKLRTAVKIDNNIYYSDYICSPLTFGIIRPKIFIPFNTDNKDYENIIAHEKAHIKRLDNITKPIAFILLSINWYNPLIWLAFVLFEQDIELACDEKVIRYFNNKERLNYSQTLLNLSKSNNHNSFYTLTLGGKNIKKRIKSVVNYKTISQSQVTITIIVLLMLTFVSVSTPRFFGARPGIITFANFDENRLDENEYLCSLDGIVFKAKITDYNIYNIYYTFPKGTDNNIANSIYKQEKEYIAKIEKSQGISKTVYSKREAMNDSIYLNYPQILKKYIDSIRIK